MVVQLAKKVMGATVVALASPAKHGYLRDLGADETVDYAAPDWETKVGVRSVDAVFDAAGGEVLSRAWTTVKDDGVVLTIADPPPPWAFDKEVAPKEREGRSGVRYLYFILSPDSEALGKIGGLIDDGALKPLPVVRFPVDRAVEAWEAARQRGRQGKVVVDFVTDA
jgi:NADPH:quinone reductase-like Zn-dependent oxidoreductase